MAPRVWTGLAAPVAVVSILLLAVAVGSAWYIHSLQKSVAQMLADHVTSVRAAQELELSARELRTQGVRYLVSWDPKQLEPIPRQQERVMAALAHAEELALTPPEKSLMARTRRGLQTFFAEYDRMTGGNPNQANYLKTLELIDSLLAAEVIEPTREYLRLNEGALARANEENRALAARLTTGLVGLGVCGAAGGLLAGWVIASALRKNLMVVEDRLRTTAQELNQAARAAEDATARAGRTADALDDMAQSATAVLARLRQTERDALRAEQLAWVGQMAAGIAHEVRNPLMAIKLLVQAHADGRGGDRLRPRDVQVLEEEIVRVEQIVTSFLDFARPPRPDKRPVEVGPLVRQVADRVRPRADLQGVSVEVDGPARPVVVDADPNQLQQVLYNLIYNAIDAQPGGGRVRVSAAVEDGGRALAVRVEDDGPGVPAAVRDRLFEPFVSTKESGMGLGLSICRRIAEGHGGEIAAAGRPGGGAAFTVRLPLAAGGPPARPAVASAAGG